MKNAKVLCLALVFTNTWISVLWNRISLLSSSWAPGSWVEKYNSTGASKFGNSSQDGEQINA